MDHEKIAVDNDSDLSFEALTFGDGDHARQLQKKDKMRKKPNKRDSPHTAEGERDRGTSLYISTQEPEKMDVQALLHKLEQFGAVRGYYFKENANFGIVQFVDYSVVDAVLEHFDPSELGFQVSVERSRTKEMHASPHSFGSMPASTPTIASTPPPEKPDTILVLKNLPFTLKQDQLHEILLSLSTTIPQSISLHYDNAGVFRGMAFIKYRQLDDAIQVYELLNGMDVGGRKVRVEYKRKPAGGAAAAAKPVKPAPVDIPAEWQEDEELRRLWEQLKEFKEDPSQSEWFYPSNLTNHQRRHIYNMSEKLKLTQGTAGEGVNDLKVYLRKGPDRNGIASPRTPEQFSGSVGDKSRGIEIKGRRRNESDPRSGMAGSPSSVGRSFGNGMSGSVGKSTVASSAPADMHLDWRHNQPNGNGNNNLQQQQLQQQQQQQQPLVAPVRQPKGPDGSKGFGTSRKLTLINTCAFLAPPTEVSVA